MNYLKKWTYVLPLMLLLMAGACKKDNDCIEPKPDPRPVIDTGCYAVTPYVMVCYIPEDYIQPTQLMIQDAYLEGDYMKLRVSYSGCGRIGNNEFALQYILKDGTEPQQVNLVLTTWHGQEMCQAYFEHELCFDLKPLQEKGNGEVVLDLGNNTQPLVYRYGTAN